MIEDLKLEFDTLSISKLASDEVTTADRHTLNEVVSERSFSKGEMRVLRKMISEGSANQMTGKSSAGSTGPPAAAATAATPGVCACGAKTVMNPNGSGYYHRYCAACFAKRVPAQKRI